MGKHQRLSSEVEILLLAPLKMIRRCTWYLFIYHDSTD